MALKVTMHTRSEHVTFIDIFCYFFEYQLQIRLRMAFCKDKVVTVLRLQQLNCTRNEYLLLAHGIYAVVPYLCVTKTCSTCSKKLRDLVLACIIHFDIKE